MGEQLPRLAPSPRDPYDPYTRRGVEHRPLVTKTSVVTEVIGR